jgi:hypothetical protein
MLQYKNTAMTFTELAYFVSVCRAVVTMSFKKIVLKSTTMMSLNERWDATLNGWQAQSWAESLAAADVWVVCRNMSLIRIRDLAECIYISRCASWHSCSVFWVPWVWILPYCDRFLVWFSSVSHLQLSKLWPFLPSLPWSSHSTCYSLYGS